MNAMVKGGGEVCLMTYPTPPYDVPYIVFYTSGVNTNKKGDGIEFAELIGKVNV